MCQLSGTLCAQNLGKEVGKKGVHIYNFPSQTLMQIVIESEECVNDCFVTKSFLRSRHNFSAPG